MKSIAQLKAYAAARGLRIEVTTPKKEEPKKVNLQVKRKGD